MASILAYESLALPLAEASQLDSVWSQRAQRRDGPLQLASLPAALTADTAPLRQLTESAVRAPGVARRVSPRVPSSLAALAAAVPARFADVRDAGAPAAALGAPVVILQDVHFNPEAQRNLAGALDALLGSGLVGRVGVEAAVGPFDFAAFRAFPDRALTRALAEVYLRKNRISAPAFVGVTTARPVPFVGVDDATHYERNVAAARAALQRDGLADQVTGLQRAWRARRAERLSSAVQRFESLRDGYRDGTTPLGAYLAGLSAFGGSPSLVIDQFLEAHRTETSLDWTAVERERREVVRRLSERLDERGMADLVRLGLAHRSGDVGFGEFHRAIRELCATAGLDLAATPTFDRYLRYVLLADGVKPDALFDAVRAWEESILGSIASPSERREIALGERLHLAGRLVRLELTPDDWAALRRALGASDPDPLASRLAALPLADHLAFYREADARSERMVATLLAGSPRGARVLVTGGFHADEIVEALRRANVPYLVFAPRLSAVEGQPSAYLSVFTRERTPIERLFAGEKLFLGARGPLIGSASPDAVATGRQFRGERAAFGRKANEPVDPAAGVAVRPLGGDRYEATVDGVTTEVTAGAIADAGEAPSLAWGHSARQSANNVAAIAASTLARLSAARPGTPAWIVGRLGREAAWIAGRWIALSGSVVRRAARNRFASVALVLALPTIALGSTGSGAAGWASGSSAVLLVFLATTLAMVLVQWAARALRALGARFAARAATEPTAPRDVRREERRGTWFTIIGLAAAWIAFHQVAGLLGLTGAVIGPGIPVLSTAAAYVPFLSFTPSFLLNVPINLAIGVLVYRAVVSPTIARLTRRAPPVAVDLASGRRLLVSADGNWRLQAARGFSGRSVGWFLSRSAIRDRIRTVHGYTDEDLEAAFRRTGLLTADETLDDVSLTDWLSLNARLRRETLVAKSNVQSAVLHRLGEGLKERAERQPLFWAPYVAVHLFEILYDFALYAFDTPISLALAPTDGYLLRAADRAQLEARVEELLAPLRGRAADGLSDEDRRRLAAAQSLRSVLSTAGVSDDVVLGAAQRAALDAGRSTDAAARPVRGTLRRTAAFAQALLATSFLGAIDSGARLLWRRMPLAVRSSFSSGLVAGTVFAGTSALAWLGPLLTAGALVVAAGVVVALVARGRFSGLSPPARRRWILVAAAFAVFLIFASAQLALASDPLVSASRMLTRPFLDASVTSRGLLFVIAPIAGTVLPSQVGIRGKDPKSQRTIAVSGGALVGGLVLAIAFLAPGVLEGHLFHEFFTFTNFANAYMLGLLSSAGKHRRAHRAEAVDAAAADQRLIFETWPSWATARPGDQPGAEAPTAPIALTYDEAVRFLDDARRAVAAGTIPATAAFDLAIRFDVADRRGLLRRSAYPATDKDKFRAVSPRDRFLLAVAEVERLAGRTVDRSSPIYAEVDDRARAVARTARARSWVSVLRGRAALMGRDAKGDVRETLIQAAIKSGHGQIWLGPEIEAVLGSAALIDSAASAATGLEMHVAHDYLGLIERNRGLSVLESGGQIIGSSLQAVENTIAVTIGWDVDLNPTNVVFRAAATVAGRPDVSHDLFLNLATIDDRRADLRRTLDRATAGGDGSPAARSARGDALTGTDLEAVRTLLLQATHAGPGLSPDEAAALAHALASLEDGRLDGAETAAVSLALRTLRTVDERMREELASAGVRDAREPIAPAAADTVARSEAPAGAPVVAPPAETRGGAGGGPGGGPDEDRDRAPRTFGSRLAALLSPLVTAVRPDADVEPGADVADLYGWVSDRSRYVNGMPIAFDRRERPDVSVRYELEMQMSLAVAEWQRIAESGERELADRALDRALALERQADRLWPATSFDVFAIARQKNLVRRVLGAESGEVRLPVISLSARSGNAAEPVVRNGPLLQEYRSKEETIAALTERLRDRPGDAQTMSDVLALRSDTRSIALFLLAQVGPDGRIGDAPATPGIVHPELFLAIDVFRREAALATSDAERGAWDEAAQAAGRFLVNGADGQPGLYDAERGLFRARNVRGEWDYPMDVQGWMLSGLGPEFLASLGVRVDRLIENMMTLVPDAAGEMMLLEWVENNGLAVAGRGVPYLRAQAAATDGAERDRLRALADRAERFYGDVHRLVASLPRQDAANGRGLAYAYRLRSADPAARFDPSNWEPAVNQPTGFDPANVTPAGSSRISALYTLFRDLGYDPVAMPVSAARADARTAVETSFRAWRALPQPETAPQPFATPLTDVQLPTEVRVVSRDELVPVAADAGAGDPGRLARERDQQARGAAIDDRWTYLRDAWTRDGGALKTPAQRLYAWGRAAARTTTDGFPLSNPDDPTDRGFALLDDVNAEIDAALAAGDRERARDLRLRVIERAWPKADGLPVYRTREGDRSGAAANRQIDPRVLVRLWRNDLELWMTGRDESLDPLVTSARDGADRTVGWFLEDGFTAEGWQAEDLADAVALLRAMDRLTGGVEAYGAAADRAQSLWASRAIGTGAELRQRLNDPRTRPFTASALADGLATIGPATVAAELERQGLALTDVLPSMRVPPTGDRFLFSPTMLVNWATGLETAIAYLAASEPNRDLAGLRENLRVVRENLRYLTMYPGTTDGSLAEVYVRENNRYLPVSGRADGLARAPHAGGDRGESARVLAYLWGRNPSGDELSFRTPSGTEREAIAWENYRSQLPRPEPYQVREARENRDKALNEYLGYLMTYRHFADAWRPRREERYEIRRIRPGATAGQPPVRIETVGAVELERQLRSLGGVERVASILREMEMRGGVAAGVNPRTGERWDIRELRVRPAETPARYQPGNLQQELFDHLRVVSNAYFGMQGDLDFTRPSGRSNPRPDGVQFSGIL